MKIKLKQFSKNWVGRVCKTKNKKNSGPSIHHEILILKLKFVIIFMGMSFY